MVELFNNEKNKDMVFNVNTQGLEQNNLEVRMLLLTNENKNLFFVSEVNEGKVCFTLPPLSELNEAQKGKLRLEVVADGEYFKPWESEFTIKTKKSLVVSAPIIEESTQTPPKVLVVELDTQEKVDLPVAEKKSVAVNQKPVAAKTLTKNVVPLVDKPVKKEVTKPVVETVKRVVPSVTEEETLTFEDFLKNKGE